MFWPNYNFYIYLIELFQNFFDHEFLSIKIRMFFKCPGVICENQPPLTINSDAHLIELILN